MSLLLANRALVGGEEEEKILVTMTPTAGFTVGFNLSFTGNVYIDFKDGGGKEALTSGVEKTHLYAGAATYVAEITGDLLNITAFIADSNRITFISGFKTGLLTSLLLNVNLLSGNLDLTHVPIGGVLAANANSNLTSITFAPSGNSLMTAIGLEFCNLSALDFSNLPVSGLLRVHSNPNLASMLFAASGNSKITDYQGQSCNFSALDFSNVPVGGSFRTDLNPNLASLIFAIAGNSIITSFQGQSCNLTTLDLSNVPIGGLFLIFLNPNLISIIFAPSGNSKITAGAFRQCNFSALDFGNVPVGGILQVNSNPNLTAITFSTTGNSVLTSLDAYSCNLNYVNTANLALNANNCNWQFQNNSMVVADVNHMLVDAYSLVSGEGVGGDFTGRAHNDSGTNAAPDGSSGGYDGLTAKTNLQGKGFTVITS